MRYGSEAERDRTGVAKVAGRALRKIIASSHAYARKM
jgi:hypothetical protein